MWERSCGSGKEFTIIPLLIDRYTGDRACKQTAAILKLTEVTFIAGPNVISKSKMAICLLNAIADIMIYKKWRCGEY